MLYSLVAGVQKYDPPLTESHNEEKRNIMHINATQLTLIAHFDSKKKMVSDKLQTAFKKALVPEVNCYFCHLPLFSFYQIKGVILRLVLKSCLRHLWFWLMYSITREKKQLQLLTKFSCEVCAKEPIGKQSLSCHHHHHKARSVYLLIASQWLLQWSLARKETF